MAITNAQQARQIYKKGSKPVEQAGVMNYMPSEMVTVPKIAKSSPDTPTAKLAYITPKEEDILVDLNLYGSLDGNPNRGPGGIPSLEGDFGPGGQDFGSFEGGADFGGARDSSGRAGDFSGARDTGTGNYVESSPDVSIDRQRKFRAQQLNKTKEAEDRRNAAIEFEKQKAKKDKRKLEIVKGLFEDDEEDVAYDVFDTNKDGKIGILEGLNKKRTELARKTLTNSIAQKLGVMPKSYVPSVFMSDMLRTTPKGVNVNTLDDMLAPDFDMGLYGLSGKDLTRAQQQLDVAKQDIISQDDFDRVYGNQPPPREDGGPSQVITDPCKGPNPPAYCFIGANANENTEAQEENPQAIPYRLMADGGIMDSMDENIRQQLFLGGVAKGIKKAVKGATRAVKKIAKSPIGKAALLYAGGSYLSGAGLLKGLPGAGVLKNPKFLNFMFKDGVPGFSNLTGKGMMAGIGALSALPLLGIGTGDDEEEGEQDRGPGLDISGIRRNPYLAMQRTGNPYRLMAEGGDTEDAEPVAKKTMPLLDMGGKEKDYRETGGFVDMGRMEKADDVPARLSKNEFVFTADAVRNAGEGDIDKGAEVMYNMMKNLESGGEVSEESQGLEGAKEMFQTSQRLEGVM